MSVTSFIAAPDAKITPVPAAFESAISIAVGNSKNASSGDNLFSCVAKVASSIAAQITGPGASDEHNTEGKPQQLKQPEPEIVVIEEIDRGNQEFRGTPQDDKEAAGALDNDVDRARNNWLELRARVQSVDPRVFAYKKTPSICSSARKLSSDAPH